MPEHIFGCHPFVGVSFLTSGRDEENDSTEESSASSQSDNGGTVSMDTSGVPDIQGRVNAIVANSSATSRNNGTPTKSNGGAEARRNYTAVFSSDRGRAFFIDDGPRAGTACFFAVKNVKPSSTAAESGTN